MGTILCLAVAVEGHRRGSPCDASEEAGGGACEEATLQLRELLTVSTLPPPLDNTASSVNDTSSVK